MKYVELNKMVTDLVGTVSIYGENPKITVKFDNSLNYHLEIVEIRYTIYDFDCTVYYNAYFDEDCEDITCSFTTFDKSSKGIDFLNTKIVEFDTLEQLIDHVSTHCRNIYHLNSFN